MEGTHLEIAAAVEEQKRQRLEKQTLMKLVPHMVSILENSMQDYFPSGQAPSGTNSILPLVCYADVFFGHSLHDMHVAIRIFLDTKRQKDIWDPDEQLKLEVVTCILAKLDCDKRINGKLAPLFKTREVVTDLIDLLSFYQNHPSRSEVLYLEPAAKQEAPRGALRDLVVMGRVPELVLALDIFLECSECQITGRSIPKMPQISLVVSRIWKAVDIDGDGKLSHEESGELTRVILSRPALGKLLLAMVCSDPAHSLQLPDETSGDKENLFSLVPVVICKAAQKADATAAEMWGEMDRDGNGEVVENEFCSFFPVAFSTAIAIPLARMISGHVPKRQSELRQPIIDKSGFDEILPMPKQRTCQRTCMTTDGGMMSEICGLKEANKIDRSSSTDRSLPTAKVPVEFDVPIDPDDPMFIFTDDALCREKIYVDNVVDDDPRLQVNGKGCNDVRSQVNGQGCKSTCSIM